jgi:glycosyltransferase involved in cell wall biosynthesis
MKKKISVMSPCFNEEGNIEELYARVKNVFEVTLAGKYDWEILFIDNASKDQTPKILKSLAQKDSKIKVILNTRNFGHIRSPHYALLQTDGDATICMASDLQDPPEVIPGFIKEWEQGFKVIVGTKDKSLESPGMFAVRKFYYWLVGKISSIELIQNFTGFGLYDRTVIETLRKVPDPYPYFRGLIAELGWEVQKIPFVQPRRKRGITANNFYTLYDMAILGITSHSRVPLNYYFGTKSLLDLLRF